MAANRGDRLAAFARRRSGLGTSAAVYTDPMPCTHVAGRRRPVRLPQTTDHLNAEAITAAQAAGADAVHPGYGFPLGVTPNSAAAVQEAGLTRRATGGRGARDGPKNRVQEADGRRRAPVLE